MSASMSAPAIKIRNAKNRRNQRKSVARKLKKTRLGFIPMVSLAIIIALLSMHLWNNWVKIGQKNEQISMMREEFNHKRINNEALEQRVKAIIDDEYMGEVARENGYRKSDEIIFYLNGGD